jgi:hypothetical protein
VPTKLSDLTTLPVSAKLPPDQVDWLHQQARTSESMTHVLRRLVDDARLLFGIPILMRDRLLADMEQEGIQDERSYVIHLLMLRYNDLLAGDLSGSRPVQSLGPASRKSSERPAS